MKKLIVLTVLMCVSLFALDLDSTTYEIKRATIDAIKDGDMTVIVDLLKKAEQTDFKKQQLIVHAIEQGFNYPMTEVKKKSALAVELLLLGDYSIPLNIVRRAGGKWSLQISTNAKAAIPRGAVEKPTLSTNPAANSR